MRTPIKLILFTFEEIQKIPNDVDVAKTRRPRGFERNRLRRINIDMIVSERNL